MFLDHDSPSPQKIKQPFQNIFHPHYPTRTKSEVVTSLLRNACHISYLVSYVHFWRQARSEVSYACGKRARCHTKNSKMTSLTSLKEPGKLETHGMCKFQRYSLENIHVQSGSCGQEIISFCFLLRFDFCTLSCFVLGMGEQSARIRHVLFHLCILHCITARPLPCSRKRLGPNCQVWIISCNANHCINYNPMCKS